MRLDRIEKQISEKNQDYNVTRSRFNLSTVGMGLGLATGPLAASVSNINPELSSILVNVVLGTTCLLVGDYTYLALKGHGQRKDLDGLYRDQLKNLGMEMQYLEGKMNGNDWQTLSKLVLRFRGLYNNSKVTGKQDRVVDDFTGNFE